MSVDPVALAAAIKAAWDASSPSLYTNSDQEEAREDLAAGIATPIATAIDTGGGGLTFNDAEGNPADLGVAADGTSTYAARRDHVHTHGNQAGGALHNLAGVGGLAGFMSDAQVTKLAGIATGATAGVTTLGAPTGTNANGGVISGVTYTASFADATNPGMVSTTTQTFAGAKTFTGAGVFSSTLGVTGALTVDTTTLVIDATNHIVKLGSFPGYTTSATNVTQNAMGRVNVVNNDGANFLSLVVDSYSGGASNPVGNTLTFRGARGTQASPTAVQTDDYIGDISGRGWHSGGAFSGARAGVFMRAGSAWTNTSNETYVEVHTTPASSIVPSQRLKIHGTGMTATGATVINPTVAGGALTISAALTDMYSFMTSSTLNADIFIAGLWNNPTHAASWFDGVHGFWGTSTAHPIQFRTSNIGRMLIATNGNITCGQQSDLGFGLGVAGTLGVNGNITVNTNKLTVTASTGAVVSASTVTATGATLSTTGNAGLTFDSGTGGAGGNQTSFQDFKLNGVLKGNIACSEADTGTPLGFNSATALNVSLVAGGGNVVVGTLADDASGAKVQVTGGVKTTLPNTYSAATGITAFAGGGQASATALTKEINFVTTVASATDSVKLMTSALGLSVEVWNLHATNSMNIYPVTGGAIDNLGTNIPYPLAAGACRTFSGQSATQWRSR